MNLPLILATCGGQIAITSEEISYCAGGFAIGVTLALLLLSLHRRSLAWAPLYVPLLLLHPAWTMSLRAGDCGLAMRFLSVCASLTLGAIMICQIFWPHLSRRRFILSLCLISWAAYLVAWPLDVVLSHYGLMTGPNGGVGAQTLFSFILGAMDLRPVALALTFVWFLQGLSERIGHTPFSRPNLQNAGADRDIRSSERKPHLRSRLPLQISASVLFLTLITLYVSALFLRPLINLAPLFALGWSVILIITVVRGKLPGWHA